MASLLVAVVTSSAPASADPHETSSGTGSSSKAVCADAYKAGQTLRKNGSLRRARESLLLCASDRCPSVLQPDCMRWLTEVEAALPTVSFAAKGPDGKDVMNVRVSMDGEVVTDALDGKSVPVDPGQHTFKFERAGESPLEQQVVLREGEKARVVSVSWAKAAEPTATMHASDAAPSSGGRTAAYIIGGIGVAGLATFTTLAIHGMSRRSELEKECFGSCTEAQVDPVKTELLVADVALGVGVAAIGVATVLFLTSGSSSPERASSAPTTATRPARRGPSFALDVGPRTGGAAVGVSGRF